MHESKLIQLLKTLSKYELNRLRVFLESPAFNCNAGVVRLFDALSRFHPDYTDGMLKKERFLKSFSATKRYSAKALGYLAADLVRRAEEFIVWQKLRNEPVRYTLVLSEALSSRTPQNRALKDSLHSLDELLRRHPLYDTGFLLNRYLHEKQTWYAMYGEEKNRSRHTNIDVVTESLDRFYLAEKLKICCEIINARNVLSTEYKVALLDEVINHLRHHNYDDTLAVAIYFRILLMLTEPGQPQHFEELLTVLEKHGKKFSREELLDMYKYAMNYCIRKINTGEADTTDYRKRLFEIYKITLRNGILMAGGILSQWDYKNIVTLGLRLKETAWVGQFIREYRQRLNPGEAKNAYTYNMAWLCFHKKEFPKALSLLQKVNFTDVYYRLDARALMLKLYYETDAQEAFWYHADAFRIFLRRKKIVSDYQRIIYSNLLRFTAKLYRIGQDDEKRLRMLRSRIEATRQTADMQWLLEKIDGLL